MGVQLAAALHRTTQLNSEQLRTTQLNSEQLRTTQNNSAQLRTTQNNSEQLRTTQLNSEQLRTTQLRWSFVADGSTAHNISVGLSFRSQHIAPILASFHWLPIKQRIEYKLATLRWSFIL